MTNSRAIRSASRPVTVKGSFLASVRYTLDLWRQRRALARLDDAMLADIGITRAEAQLEAERPLWNAPSTWLK